MCNWFSCVSNGKGKVYFFNGEQRKEIKEGTLVDKSRNTFYPDSHSSISAFFGLDDDKVNKYEYRPLDRRFIVDQINCEDDQKQVLRKICQLDFSKLAPPELILKPIVHPLKDRKRTRISKKDLELLKTWISVWDSVVDSVGAYISSFFNLKKWKYIKHPEGKNPYQSGIDLWERGVIPVFNGDDWYLFGYEGKLLKKIKKTDL